MLITNNKGKEIAWTIIPEIVDIFKGVEQIDNMSPFELKVEELACDPYFHRRDEAHKFEQCISCVNEYPYHVE